MKKCGLKGTYLFDMSSISILLELDDDVLQPLFDIESCIYP
jgi:hypothetical protein